MMTTPTMAGVMRRFSRVRMEKQVDRDGRVTYVCDVHRDANEQKRIEYGYGHGFSDESMTIAVREAITSLQEYDEQRGYVRGRRER